MKSLLRISAIIITIISAGIPWVAYNEPVRLLVHSSVGWMLAAGLLIRMAVAKK